MTKLKHRSALNNIASYTPAKSIEAIQKDLGIYDIIRLSANENNFGCSPLVNEAIQSHFNDLFLYPDGQCTKLRNKLSEVYNLKPEQLIFGNGSFELLSLIGRAFLNPGEESIIPVPSFGWYKIVTLEMDGVIVPVPLKNYSINLDDIKNKVTKKTKIIWLCNPNNPTGTIFHKDDFEKFLEAIPTAVILVLDEAYYEFVLNSRYPQTVSYLEKHPNIIILRTFSKVYGLASLRIGYGIANPKLIDLLNRIRLPINVNALAQISALASLEDQAFRNNCIENNNNGRIYFYKAFSDLGLEFIPTETNFIMVNVHKDSVIVVNELLKKGIAVRPGSEFGMNTWLRITIGKPNENSFLVKALTEVLNSL